MICIQYEPNELGNDCLACPISYRYWSWKPHFLSYMGHLKERTLKDQMAKDPTEVIRKAVLRMLPRNKLRAVSAATRLSLHPTLELKLVLRPCLMLSYFYANYYMSRLLFFGCRRGIGNWEYSQAASTPSEISLSSSTKCCLDKFEKCGPAQEGLSFGPRRRLSSNSKVGMIQRKAKGESKLQKLLREGLLSLQRLHVQIKFLLSCSFKPLFGSICYVFGS